jgi:hypothetical protein
MPPRPSAKQSADRQAPASFLSTAALIRHASMKIPCPPTSPAAMHLATTPSNTRRKASLPPSLPASKHRCYKILHTGADAGLHAVLHNDRAGHSRADQHALRHPRQTNADGNALRKPDPGERRVYRRKQLRTIAVVLVGNSSRCISSSSAEITGCADRSRRSGSPWAIRRWR